MNNIFINNNHILIPIRIFIKQRLALVLSLILLLIYFPDINSFSSKTETDTLVDVLPLSTGNQWTYRYYTVLVSWPSGNPGSITIDSGTVKYSIVGNDANSDSTLWHFKVNRDIIHHVILSFTNKPDSHIISPIYDSSYFDLIENNIGQHQIYRNADPYSIRTDIFPFTRDYTDTTMIYRYRSVEQGDTITISSWIEPPLGPYFQRNFTFLKDIGLIRNTYNSGTIDVVETNEHILLNSIITSVDPEKNLTIPSAYQLFQNYPNPFNSSTIIKYLIKSKGLITLKILDILGREIAVLADGISEPGSFIVHWDGDNFASGIYFYQLKVGSSVLTKKMLLLK